MMLTVCLGFLIWPESMRRDKGEEFNSDRNEKSFLDQTEQEIKGLRCKHELKRVKERVSYR